MRHSVFIACLLCALVASSYAATVVKVGYLSYNNMVVTSNGDGNQVTLAPIVACDKTQEWALDSDGFIYQKSNSSLVLDVQNSDTRNGASVIMWNKKTPIAPNQRWALNATGVYSMLNGYYLRKSSTSNNVVMSNNQPIQLFAFTDNPNPCPATCTSHGDPHFTAWNGRRFDFQSPNTVLLANWSGTRLYTVQFGCAPGVTCNEGFVVHPAGTTDTFQLTGTTIAYFNKVSTTVAMGFTSYSSYINVTRTSTTSFTVWLPGASIVYAAYKWQYGWYINIGVSITAPAVLGNSICLGPTGSQTPHSFGLQFLVSNKNNTAYQYAGTPFNYDPNYTPNYGPYTTNDTALIQQATTICGALMSTPGYGVCNAFVPPDFYYGTCINDTYATGNIEFAQMSLDAYAYLCSVQAAANGTTIVLPTTSTTTVIVNAMTTINSYTTTTFTIIAKDINNKNRTTGGDSFTITSTGGYVFTIVDNNDGTYTVTYTTGIEGTYTISVKLNNVSDVSNSPFTITVVATTSAMTSSIVLGPVYTGMQSSFTIQARTSSGANRVQGGDTFSVTFNGGSFSLVGITDNNDGTYTVWYIPYTAGYFTISITFLQTSIMCSPINH